MPDLLIGMMKVGFLKRLESSVHSFALTMQRTMNKIEALETRLGTFKTYRENNPEIDFDTLTLDDTEDEDKVLQPYVLVYVLESGDVRFGFVHPKQILTMYRDLCAGKPDPHEGLCNLFDQLTHDGTNMAPYDRLPQRAVDSIVATFRKRVAAGLQNGRSFVIPNQHEQGR